jgi:hypothetical protein
MAKSLKISPSYLNKEELTYEHRIRGLTVGSVEEVRGTLVNTLQAEREDPSIRQQFPVHPFTNEENENYCTEKVGDLRGLIEGMTKKDVRKIESKLCHVLGRIKCISGDSVERHDLLADALALNQAFEDKRDAFRKPAELELLEATLEKILDLSTSTPVEPTLPARNVNMAATSNVKSVPVYKWGLKFSGQGDSSVNAFLQRVDELMTARHVDQNEVFLSALDLFEGNALKWYRNNRTSVSNWEELKRGLRSEFQPLNYNEKLFREIRRRTQGHDEGVGIYLDNMKGLFSRLTAIITTLLRTRRSWTT